MQQTDAFNKLKNHFRVANLVFVGIDYLSLVFISSLDESFAELAIHLMDVGDQRS